MATDASSDASTTETFANRLRGDLLRPGEDGYEDARTVWNGMVDKRPSLVVRPRGASDVVAALEFARTEGMEFTVKGGGHSVAGHSAIDGGLLIDLSEMDDVRVDAGAKTVRVGGGATLGDVDHETQAFGLATTLGVASPTGIAGLTLGGGNGHLSRAYGLACDNLLSADVVTADGRFVRASETENADLFWAIRGGGGNFGVVTSFEFRLHEVGPEVLAGPIFHPFEDAADVFRAAREFMRDAADEIGCLVGFMTLPPEEPFPADLQGTPAAFLLPFYAGSVEDGESALAPLRDIGEPILDGIAPLPYVGLQQMFDEANPAGNRYYWKSQLFTDFSDEAIDALVSYLEANPLPTPFTTVTGEILGGAINRIPADATAYPHRDATFDLGIWGNWTDAEDDERVTQWVRDCHASVAPHADAGVYVNYLDSDEDDRVRAAFGENFERLAEIKAVWDPENRFSNTKNVEPAA